MSTGFLREDLCRLARFGANITDAFGCYVLLPQFLLSRSEGEAPAASENLLLGGYHSLSTEVIRDATINTGNGLVGWVAKHKRSIHVSPFERDSRTLGFYHTDQQLKSFMGVPIFLDRLEGSLSAVCGVVACDSKKSYAFSKLQGKLLEDLSCEISNTLRLAYLLNKSGAQKQSWQRFAARAQQLGDSIGRDSLEILRVRIANQEELEGGLGSAQSVALIEHVLRLIEQALPPHFPCFRTPTGEIIMAVDNMMTSFLENKILAVCSHCSSNSTAAGTAAATVSIDIRFTKRSNRMKKYRRLSIAELIDASGKSDPEQDQEAVRSQNFGRSLELAYEYKRA